MATEGGGGGGGGDSEFVAGFLLLVVLISCDADALARAVHEFLLESKKSFSVFPWKERVAENLHTHICQGHGKSAALVVSLIVHVTEATLEKNVCPPRTFQNILTVSKPCETS